jgi:hypothetical protein
MTVPALPDGSLDVNRRIREALRQAIAEQGLKEVDVARRLGHRPDWIYTRFSTKSGTLRFSFCVRVLLACGIPPGQFFHRILNDLEGQPLPVPPPPPAPTRAEIRRKLEPVVVELLEERARKGRLAAWISAKLMRRQT